MRRSPLVLLVVAAVSRTFILLSHRFHPPILAGCKGEDGRPKGIALQTGDIFDVSVGQITSSTPALLKLLEFLEGDDDSLPFHHLGGRGKGPRGVDARALSFSLVHGRASLDE